METGNTHLPDEATISVLPPATGSSNINIGTSERVVSALGGAALAVWGLRNLNSVAGLVTFLGGGYFMVRGISGYCYFNNLMGRNTAEGQKKASAMEVRTTYTIAKPRSEVYAFWRKLENLPRFMQHLEKVEEMDDKRSTWTAKIPGGMGTVSWEAEIINDIRDELISWTSLPGSTVDNAGDVRFKEAGSGNATELNICISYRLPAGHLGSLAAKLFNPSVERMMREDLRDFRRLMETGEAPTLREGRSQRTPEGDATERPAYTVSGIH